MKKRKKQYNKFHIGKVIDQEDKKHKIIQNSHKTEKYNQKHEFSYRPARSNLYNVNQTLNQHLYFL